MTHEPAELCHQFTGDPCREHRALAIRINIAKVHIATATVQTLEPQPSVCNSVLAARASDGGAAFLQDHGAQPFRMGQVQQTALGMVKTALEALDFHPVDERLRCMSGPGCLQDKH